MRASFRTILLTTLLTVLFVAVGVLGVASYVNQRFIVSDMSRRVMAQTGARIHDQIRGLLDRAAQVSDVHRHRLEGQHVGPDDLLGILSDFHDSILVRPELSYLSLGLETGDYGHVQRLPDGTLVVRTQLRRPDGRVDLTDYGFVDGRMVPVAHEIDDYDPRQRPYYVRAREARRQTWPDVYLFRNRPNPDVPGLTCATPLYDYDNLVGVLTADFDLIALGRFLEGLVVFDHGYAFVVEFGKGGERRIVAHPDPSLLIGPVERDGQRVDDVLPLAQVRDPRVRAFVDELPTTTANGTDADFGEVRFEVSGETWLGAYLPLESDHDLRWLIGIVVPAEDVMGPVSRASVQTLIIGLVSLLVAGLLGIVLAARLARPLKALADETGAIGRFHLAPRPPSSSGVHEVVQLSSAVEEMKTGLRSFGKFVPTDLVRDVLASGAEAELGGERRVLSVFFSDIAGFTTLAEGLTPEMVVDQLGEYFAEMSAGIESTGGTVDKYIGDGVMAFWGAPKTDEQHATNACLAALQIQRRLADLNQRWTSAGRPALVTRIGISSGGVVVGNIGSASRLSYTVMGDTVNVASRLEGLNKAYGTSVLIADTTHELAGDAVVARPLERVTVKGREGYTLVYELLGIGGAVDDDVLEVVELAEQALTAFYNRAFDEARAIFERILKLKPGDVAARALIERCLRFSKDPPPDDWDGVRRFAHK